VAAVDITEPHAHTGVFMPAPIKVSSVPIKPVTYSVEQAVKATGLCYTTINKLVREGKLESFKVGKRRLITAKGLHQFIDECLAVQNPPEPLDD
jgi:excisionase family DNA binding protein